ncbi:MAG: hypothetical protein ABIJ56_03005 [Pseudomonadota bacterium]
MKGAALLMMLAPAAVGFSASCGGGGGGDRDGDEDPIDNDAEGIEGLDMEAPDDGGAETGDDVEEAVDAPPGCGNGTVEGWEECDDGANGDPDDGCRDNCMFSCHENEDCDDENPCTDDACETETSHACIYPVAPATTVCRPSTDPCDPDESCDGITADCPADAFLSEGTECDDRDPCTGPDACDFAGVCGGPYLYADLSAGSTHACTRTTSSQARCWGWNYYGQLGDGTTTDSGPAVGVSGMSTGSVDVSAGNMHSCGVLAGAAKCWGRNNMGQLGNGTTTDSAEPVDVTGLSSGVTAAATGGLHSCAILDTALVRCWGKNDQGQLGDGTIVDKTTPVEAWGLHPGVTELDTGDAHSCALITTGGVRCWGDNVYGQLGDGTTFSRATAGAVFGLVDGCAGMSAGLNHTCALLDEGGVKCWGNNADGQLGDGTTDNAATPVDVSGLTDGLAVAAGGSHTCAMVEGGGVRCWGLNDYGQLGDGTTTSSLEPVDVAGLSSAAQALSLGLFYSCALLAGSEIQCWGRNDNGQLGDGTTTDSAEPVNVTCI